MKNRHLSLKASRSEPVAPDTAAALLMAESKSAAVLFIYVIFYTYFGCFYQLILKLLQYEGHLPQALIACIGFIVSHILHRLDIIYSLITGIIQTVTRKEYSFNFS